ncbi:hypothetical protein J6590_070544 [Homalodisca vitripennis]|nr:hypothetical protein J6590_070544 [Homalodisca vitripennis]
MRVVTTTCLGHSKSDPSQTNLATIFSMVFRRKEDRHIGLKDLSRSRLALSCFGKHSLDTLQDSGMNLRATEDLNSLHSWGRRISSPRCKQTGLTPSPQELYKD